MAGILKIRDPMTKGFIDIPMIVGPKGDTGDIGNLSINGKTPDASGTVTIEASDIGYGDSDVGSSLSQLKDDKLDKTATAADSAKLGGKAPEQYVQSVNNVNPDGSGKVMLTADDVGAIGNEVTSGYLTKIDTYLQNDDGYVNRVGKLVLLVISCSTKAEIPYGGQLFTIPEGFRPASNLFAIAGGTDKTANSLCVTVDGVIQNSGSPIAASIWLNMAVMYIAG